MGHRWGVPFAYRFWAKVDRVGDCWLWTGAKNDKGYGQTFVDDRLEYVHRISWQLEHGPGSIPDGMLVLHRCDNPLCVRPSHLFLGTHLDNSDDKIAKGRDRNGWGDRTHCIHGHPFSEENTYIDPRRGWRCCRTCRANRKRQYRLEGRTA